MTTAPPQPAAAHKKKHSKLDKQSIIQGLNQLHAPKDYDTDSKCVDIIAVPGLGSDMTHTWMCKGVHWLRDELMLPKAIPKARILVYGYRSQWLGPDAVDIRLSNIGRDLVEAIKVDRRESKNKKRPIIFVGHSLGGLVVSKAVTVAKRESESFKGVIDCISACVFLGTPFRGSEAQPWGKLIGRAGNVLGQAMYTSFLGILKSGSSELDDLRDEFLTDVGNTRIEVECYFELEKTYGVVFVDEKSSALDGKPRHPWARTHSDMNKFEGPKDHNYRQLSGSLKVMANQSFRNIRVRQDAPKQEIVNDVRVNKILDSLEVINPRRDLETIRRVSGLVKGVTPSSWIQHNERYTRWRDAGSSQSLWICGGAGKGKAMAAIAIVEELTQRSEHASDAAVVLGQFFCDEHDKDKSKALNVLKSLAGQLLKVRKDLSWHFFGEDNATKSGGQKSDADYEFNSLPDLWKCLKVALSDPSLGTVYFVVNSLDQIELESRRQLLSAITSFQPPLPDDDDAPSGPFVKWLFLSVPRDDIQDSLKTVSVLNLDDGSNSTKQDDDLRLYVSQKISQIAQERNYSRALEYFVKSFISLRARGKSNYDWVNLVCLELENDDLPQGAVRRRLEELPTDLYPMYDYVSHRVLQGVDTQVEYAKEILRCLLLVHTPPTLQELAILAGLPGTDRENRKELKKHVERCGALTEMFKDGAEMKVQLSHMSVREFLKSKASDWLSMGSEQIQHGVIALRCFDYVLAAVKASEGEVGQATANGKAQGHVSDAESEDNPESEAETSSNTPVETGKPLLRYPVTEWIEHALEATADIVDNLNVTDAFWLLGSKERSEWSQTYASFTSAAAQSGDGLGFDTNSTALHIAAYFGYVHLADLLLKSDQHDGELQASDRQGLQPLYWACSKGHLDMVQRLCAAGADINYQITGEHQTALHGAVLSKNPEITSFLLSHGACVNSCSKGFGSPLYMACNEGLLVIVQQLLERQADPNLVGGKKITALNAAAGSGKLDVVKILLEHGAELNPAMDYQNGNALWIACFYGHKEIAEYLLQKRCDWDKLDSEGRLPIEIAAKEGHADVTLLLLENDQRPESHKKSLLSATKANKAEVVRVLVTHCPTIPHDEAFYEAASSENTDIVKILTAAGVEPRVLERSLYNAVDYQHEGMVRLLLDMGIDPNAKGEEYGNALQASAYDGTTNILQMLLDKAADTNRVYPNSGYGTALQAACYKGNIENVKILLDRGAQANPDVSGEYGTPLAAACIQGNTEIMKLLLEHGADPNIKGGKYGFAIVAATDGGNEEILRLLLSYGADVNVKSPSGDTPLTKAAMELPMSCLELLIEHGAWLHAQDGDNDTALTNAAAAGDADSVRYLLEKGLDVQHIGKWGGALCRAIDEGKSLECVKILLEYQVDVNQKGGRLHTPLQAAAYNEDIESVQLLLNDGADVNLTGGKYHTALQAAAAADNLDLVRLLLEHGADALETGGDYGSALHAAIYASEPIDMIDLFLEHGADINAVHERGTPLHLAAAVATTAVVTYLLEKEADPNMVIGKYGTPLQVACVVEDDDTVRELLGHSADPLLRGGYYGSAFVAAAAKGMENYVKQWLSEDPPPEMLVEALHFAVHFRRTNIVKMLLDQGVDVNVKSRLFGTAMLALNAEITDTERNILEGYEEFWGPDDEYEDENEDEDDNGGEDEDDNGGEGEDDGGEGEDDDGGEDEQENGQNEGDNEDDGGSENDYYEDAEAEAKAEKEIRGLLEPLIQESFPEENRDSEPHQDSPSIPAPKPITRRPVPVRAMEPSSEPSHADSSTGFHSNSSGIPIGAPDDESYGVQEDASSAYHSSEGGNSWGESGEKGRFGFRRALRKMIP
ncbi:ankyrin repeat-containing domain protein [Aspergillus californicus]